MEMGWPPKTTQSQIIKIWWSKLKKGNVIVGSIKDGAAKVETVHGTIRTTRKVKVKAVAKVAARASPEGPAEARVQDPLHQEGLLGFHPGADQGRDPPRRRVLTQHR